MPQTDRTALSFNNGNEFTLDLAVNNQVLAEFGLIEQTSRKVNATLLEMTPTNNFGYVVRRVTYQGISMDFRVTRQDDTVDDLVDALMAAYYAQAPNVLFSGVETVINNGSVSQWTYSNGVIVPGSLGTSKGADRVDDVELTVHWSKRVKITGASNAPNLLAATSL